jgi:hypothetical protein
MPTLLRFYFLRLLWGGSRTGHENVEWNPFHVRSNVCFNEYQTVFKIACPNKLLDIIFLFLCLLVKYIGKIVPVIN